VFPGDRVPSFEKVKHIERDKYNLTDISLCVHNGTHIDAPAHFIEGGKTVEELDLSIFFGECTVAEFSGIITELQIVETLKTCRERLLLKGDCELSEEAAKAIANSHIRLFGIESQSIANAEKPMNVHVILLKNEVIPLEGLVLSGISVGEYILSAIPINLKGSDGSPVRAVLVES
jgi:arylformamidase